MAEARARVEVPALRKQIAAKVEVNLHPEHAQGARAEAKAGQNPEPRLKRHKMQIRVTQRDSALEDRVASCSFLF